MGKIKGFTLTELIVALTLSTLIIIGIIVHFASEQNFRAAVQDKIAVMREARMAMVHMSRALRFVDISDPVNRPFLAMSNPGLISATIEGGHLDNFPNDTQIQYSENTANLTLECTRGGNTVVIANNITDFDASWSNPYFTVSITSTEGEESFSFRTKIFVLQRQ